MQMVKSLESTVIIFHCLHYGVGYHSITNYNSKPFNETLGFVYLDQKTGKTIQPCLVVFFTPFCLPLYLWGQGIPRTPLPQNTQSPEAVSLTNVSHPLQIRRNVSPSVTVGVECREACLAALEADETLLLEVSGCWVLDFWDSNGQPLH